MFYNLLHFFVSKNIIKILVMKGRKKNEKWDHIFIPTTHTHTQHMWMMNIIIFVVFSLIDLLIDIDSFSWTSEFFFVIFFPLRLKFVTKRERWMKQTNYEMERNEIIFFWYIQTGILKSRLNLLYLINMWPSNLTKLINMNKCKKGNKNLY